MVFMKSISRIFHCYASHVSSRFSSKILEYGGNSPAYFRQIMRNPQFPQMFNKWINHAPQALTAVRKLS